MNSGFLEVVSVLRFANWATFLLGVISCFPVVDEETLPAGRWLGASDDPSARAASGRYTITGRYF